jgi:N-carbamoyl-L-amino-acid hydrolase
MNTIPLPFLDGEQLIEDIETLGQIGRSDKGGLLRIAFNAADLAGRHWVAEQLRALGLTVTTDAAGNTLARYAGTADLPAIAIGSHTDTVPHGGQYDGALGVLAGLACVRALHSAGLRLRHPIEIINFVAEEATMAGGTLGSHALVGSLDRATLDQPAWDGQLVREHLATAGLDPAHIGEAQVAPNRYAAFLELHVEQGETLAADGVAVGVVEGIVGIRRYLVTYTGYANHAGTTPMDRRQDALVAAAPLIPFVRETAIKHGIVGTIGTLTVEPGASNVIPGKVVINLEIRGLDERVLDRAAAALQEKAAADGGTFTPLSAKPPVQADPRLLDALTAACTDLALSHRRMPSGAGHDAMNMAALCPMAMLFVPSQNGVSHSPDEYTAPQDCVNGAQVLLAGLLKIDALL